MRKQSVLIALGRLALPVVLMILTSSRPAAADPMFSVIPKFFVIQQQTTPFVLLHAFAGFGASFPFNYFDASLGMLQGVDIDVTGGNDNPTSFYSATLNFSAFC